VRQTVDLYGNRWIGQGTQAVLVQQTSTQRSAIVNYAGSESRWLPAIARCTCASRALRDLAAQTVSGWSQSASRPLAPTGPLCSAFPRHRLVRRDSRACSLDVSVGGLTAPVKPSVTITAAAPYGPKSRVVAAQTAPRAGELSTLTVTTVDFYDNTVRTSRLPFSLSFA
jgi:hypothetical protein